MLLILRIFLIPPPKKETMDFLKYPHVWYMPLHAGIVLYGLYCAELKNSNSILMEWYKSLLEVYGRMFYRGIFHQKLVILRPLKKNCAF